MRRFVALFLAGAVLVAPANALGQGGGDGYRPVSNVLGEVGTVADSQTPVASSAPVTEAQATEGSLPFTGIELGIVAGLGILLVVAGVGLRRLHPTS